jgi:hypothetical protein
LWLVADRRLSYGDHRAPVDDAVKITILDTTDGVGLLAYAGIGATSHGTQPSEWMSAVLRGRGGLKFEQALSLLSVAANKELPRHLAGIPGGAHFIIVPAFVKGVGPRLYSIDNVVDRNAGKHWYRYTSHQRTVQPGSPSLRLALGGTGGMYLAHRGRAWQRELLSLVKAHDRGKVSEQLIADKLARLNYEAHVNVRDDTVGPRCIVVWRRRRDLRRTASGGGHQFYTGVDRESQSPALPTIANGLDVKSIVGVLAKPLQEWVADGAVSSHPFNIDKDEVNQLLAKLPFEPDEKLR